MIIKKLTSAMFGASLLATSLHAAEIGKEAPAFTLKNLKGEQVSLADFKGKPVVLEWVNFDCPFVKKHYASGNMGKLQETYAAKGVVWLTICSSAEGKQGYLEPSKMAERAAKEGNKANHFLMDTSGATGKAYGAQVTPHMFVINKEGMLVYDGGIDDKATTKTADIEGATNHVVAALDALLDGKEVATTKTKPYGCSVKY